MTFYLTTPIYYVNDVPHIGHAYTTVLADVLARYHRLLGEEVLFLTGTDEHGQKVEAAARARGVPTQQHVDEMAGLWKASFAQLGLSFDRFIRTTEPAHLTTVADLLRRIEAAGDVYVAPYVGWYCVPDERYWTEKDLVAGRCPHCGREVERLEERNYFFRMSRYQEWLVRHIRENPDFIVPEIRRNEVLGFLAQPLNDLCISRPRQRLAWGVPLPFDEDYVAYVWVDALINYVTAAGWPDGPDAFGRWWPADLHLIGKDILTTHAVYWPTLLRSAGLPPPRRIAAHGWWLRDGHKMSKSLGNVVGPEELLAAVGLDGTRWYLMREMGLANDGDFNFEGLVTRLNAELANDIGNLLSRVANMVGRYTGGSVPAAGEPRLEPSRDLRELAARTPERVIAAVGRLAVPQATEEAMALVRGTNRYLEALAPWRAARAEGSGAAAVQEGLAFAAEALRVALVLLGPVVPDLAARGLAVLGAEPAARPSIEEARWGAVPPGRVAPGAPLFARLEQAALIERFGAARGEAAGAPEPAAPRQAAGAEGRHG